MKCRRFAGVECAGLAVWLTGAFSGVAAAQCPLPSSGAVLAGGEAGAVFGDLALVGRPASEQASLFERDQGGPGAWGQVAVLVPGDGQPHDRFGFALAGHGNRAVVGSPDHGALGTGAVYVFERTGTTTWSQAAKLEPSTGQPAGAQFGYSVAVFGDTVLVGAIELQGAFTLAGGAFVFERDPQTRVWNQVSELLPPTPVLGDNYGVDVALYEDTAAIGEPGDGAGWFPGSVFIHERDLGGPSAWGKSRRVRASDKEDGAAFGWAVDLWEDTLLVGAFEHDHAGIEDSGAVYVFERDLGGPQNWGERQELLPPSPAVMDRFGEEAALHGSLALIGNGIGLSSLPGGQAHLFERGAGLPDLWFWVEGLPQVDLWEVQLDGSSAILARSGSAEIVELAPTQPFARYCTAGATSNGCRATLSACGASSGSASEGFLLQADGAAGQEVSLFFFGAQGRQAVPWGNGASLQCVVPPAQRGPPQATAGTLGACDGALALDLNAHWTAHPGQNPGAGALVQAQLWQRDLLNTGNRPSALSDALEFGVAP